MTTSSDFPEHFSLEEFTVTQHRDLNNTPSAAVLTNLADTAWKMEHIRNKVLTAVPLIVTSGFRCEDLEQRVCWIAYKKWCTAMGKGNTANSWDLYFTNKAHPKGYAVDFIAPRFGPPEKVVDAIKAAGIKFDQLILESTWTHISFDPRMRQMVFAL